MKKRLLTARHAFNAHFSYYFMAKAKRESDPSLRLWYVNKALNFGRRATVLAHRIRLCG